MVSAFNGQFLMIWEEYKMKYNIAVVPGDGIGPEVMDEALKVLEKIGRKYDCEFACTKL